MENISGYARAFARTRIKEQVSKPFLGKPYIKYGQCLALWGYLFQLGGILGAKHSANFDSFVYAFLGAWDPLGDAKEVFTKIANDLVADILKDPITFTDYINKEAIKRAGYSGDAIRYSFEHLMDKIPPERANALALEYSLAGTALGVIYPQKIKSMFDLTHKEVPKEDWERWRAAGLNIPPTQDLMNYKEIEEIENRSFMDYCREFCPDLFTILSK